MANPKITPDDHNGLMMVNPSSFVCCAITTD